MALSKPLKQKAVRASAKSSDAKVVARALETAPKKLSFLAKLIQAKGVDRALSGLLNSGDKGKKAERKAFGSSVSKREKVVVRVSGRRDDKSARGVAFGSVIIEGHPGKSTSAVVKHNVEVGRAALARAGKAFVEPGVKLGLARNIPLYHVDLERPGFLIREVDGHRERVKFINGQFVAAE